MCQNQSMVRTSPDMLERPSGGQLLPHSPVSPPKDTGTLIYTLKVHYVGPKSNEIVPQKDVNWVK